MSERAVAFVERWIGENIAPEVRPEEGADARFERFARAALSAAHDAAIPEAEILEEFPDLPSRMAEAVQGAADHALHRQLDDED